MQKFQVQIYGKKGCPKCKVLNKRMDKVLQKKEWGQFEKVYFDITTVDGLVTFGKAEFLNSQRIPSFVVCRIDGDGEPQKIKQTFDEGFDKNSRYRIPTYVGLQTDYSNNGVITPSDIEHVFQEAVENKSSGV